MWGIRRRDVLAVIIIALLSAAIVTSPALDMVHGLSIDMLTTLRWKIFGAGHDAVSSPVVVVAIDEESYHSAPFEGTPTFTWTREIGRVLTAILDGGAKVVGFDIIFPASIEQSEIPFGDDTLGARMRGFDRDFLRALALGSAAGKVVLGEVQHRDQPIRPSAGQRIAVGQQRNIRSLNAYSDSDDVVRRLPLSFSVDGKPVPSMVVELASRALGAPPELAPDGTLTLAGYRVPSVVPNTLTLNFEGGAEDIPTFSLGDLRACAENGDKEFFRRFFGGKVVLIGTLLDIEDRKITSKRFATGLERAWSPRCALLPQPLTGQFKRNSISGVYIHATAVNDLIRREALKELGRVVVGLIAAAFAVLTAVTALVLAPVGAMLAYLGMAVAWTAGATVAFKQALVFPLVEPVVGGFVALAATVAYRFVIADRDKRFLRKSFALYLAPAVIEKMVLSNKPPALGGEIRNITIFFSDVAGFSALTEKLAPSEIVAVMNEYLSAMTDIIEEQGGFVDKYIGDAIVAVFGAPLDDPDHAHNAVSAALRCRARLEELNQSASAFMGHQLGQRIGLNSGDALVGNMGSRRRFNYTVMGDAVNLASRLEGANKSFGTSIMASEMTVSLTGPAFAWRELDAIRVMGRSQAVKIYEPLAEAGTETPEQAARAAAYAEGLARWRARDFSAAMECFARVADADPPAARFLRRAKKLAEHPPGPEWEPVTALEEK
jgi:class 3 adenylate cyclase/CHASE2 domain-containing sensor protein